jgi:hypothetical protein
MSKQLQHCISTEFCFSKVKNIIRNKIVIRNF